MGSRRKGGAKQRGPAARGSLEYATRTPIAKPVAFDFPRPILPPRASLLSATLPCLMIVLLAVAFAFFPAATNEFLHWDDMTNYVENTNIRAFTWNNLVAMAKDNRLGVWQPLTWILTGAQYALFRRGGDDQTFSTGLHVTTIVAHALASALCLFVVRRLIALAAPDAARRSPMALNFGATVATLIFAVHPLRVEVVAWASGQPYVLAMVPCLACIWCYLKAHEAGLPATGAASTNRFAYWLWHAAAVFFLALSLTCKAIAVPLVAVLVVLDVYPLRRFGGAAGWSPRAIAPALLEKLPYAAITLAAALLTINATATTKEYAAEPFNTKVLTSGFCMMFYVALTFVPYHLSPNYQRITFDVGATFAVCTLLFLVLTTLFVLVRRRAPWLLAVWVCYVIVLTPVVGFVRHGGQLAADRYTYLSCIGWAILIGAAAMHLWAGWVQSSRRAALAGTALAVTAGLCLSTRSYCADWRDSINVWEAMIARNPKFYMAPYNVAKRYRDKGDREKAKELYRQAMALYREQTGREYPEANVDLGIMLRDEGQEDEAMRHFENALRSRPGFHMAHIHLAEGMVRRNNIREAIRHLELAEKDAIQTRQHHRLPMIRRRLEMLRPRAGS